MGQDQMVAWCTLFLTIVGKGAPTHALDEEFDERERNHYWKSKKWAYANLNRLFVRYVSHAQNLTVTCWHLLSARKIRQPKHQSEERFYSHGRIFEVFS